MDLEKGEKHIWDFRLHQKAYDWLMLSRYTNDLLTYLRLGDDLDTLSLEDICRIYNEEMHHPDDASLNLGKMISLAVAREDDAPGTFYELGQTIFGCIEGMDFYQKLLKRLSIDIPELPLDDVEWYGVDISQMFNKMSELLHSQRAVHAMTDAVGLPDQIDVFFSKGVTLLYAVRDLAQFFETVERGRLSVFDYSFSLAGEMDTTIGTGKVVRYLDFGKFLAALPGRGRDLYVKTQNSRIVPEKNHLWLDCVYGEAAHCEKFIEMDTQIRGELAGHFSTVPESGRFLNHEETPQWQPVREFAMSLGLAG
jgi:hypothetical protein